MDRDSQVFELKKSFRLLETKVLVLIAIPLPVFSFAYLYTSSGNREVYLPEISPVFLYLILAAILWLLFLQYNSFQKRILPAKNSAIALSDKLLLYGKAAVRRYWYLFWAGLLSALGLIVYENQIFTVTYALNLIFVSLAKPTPDRLVKALHLKNEEREMAYEINRRED
ncbi:hypothetical protein SAMN04488057_105283 [Cyclobacterium lianum]|uniref:Uncharacterized protein n=1 Tax=Cyclobacterium lianum TaxID=388280 RepID=A0A1M7NFM5_9BACT|nr:hypothetical protein [Cyclobacterium lianum]SHN02453.1 hypothetical protein SAMN04488057_105283 [Cyclobacterium lianum]